MVDRERYERIKERHGLYASWAVWAAPGATPKSNIGDLSVLDPDRNPTLLETLRTDIIMLGLNISRPGIVVEPFRNFHDASSRGQDYKIRYAFSNTPYWGAYMSDFIKDVVMLERGSMMRYVRANPSLVRNNMERLVAELNDLGCGRPTVLTFGDDTSRLVAQSVPHTLYSRLVPLMHYSNYISKEVYRLDTLSRLGSRSTL
jgi:hypothetical protein